ncbi:hypothetical protein [Methanobacterium oryzae]|uniref:hypothetical protein n=1 Tax=Methanobacterium oryzae TaxID=69540 RepID=UPI003D1B5855
MEKTDKISVFLSMGTPHKNIQQEYRDELNSYFESQGIIAETLGATFWSNEAPLIPIKKKMKEVHGAAILGMERIHLISGCEKPGSHSPSKLEELYFSTVWNHIEASMAYQTGLPLLILKEDKLFPEGIFDRGIHEWYIVEINPENPEEITNNPGIKGPIDYWIEQVKKHYEESQTAKDDKFKESSDLICDNNDNLTFRLQDVFNKLNNEKMDDAIQILTELLDSVKDSKKISEEFSFSDENEAHRVKNQFITHLSQLFKELEDENEIR